jgi:prevent-host-death family protein
MNRVGAYEAKTHLPQLLERVVAGESFTITKNGHPVALLAPLPDGREITGADALSQLRELRRGRSLGTVSIRDLIEDGRRP